MAFDATVVKAIIASPSDVPDERRIVREVIQEWNVVHAEERRVVLLPVGWETHSSPEMGDRPQAIINKQVLRNSDLLIAVFWTRLGSPTGTAPSGTVEEIEEHLSADKPAMIYFSSAPVRPENVDSEQLDRLRAFKNLCRKRGLVEEYDDVTQFREKLTRQLAQTMIRQFRSVGVGDADLPAPSPAEPLPTISSAARELLLEARQDPRGIIMRTAGLGVSNLMTHGRNFMESRDAREAARWRGALDELLRQELIEDQAGSGQVFLVTHEGYLVAERLRDQIPH